MPPWGCLSAFQAESSNKLLDTRVWNREEKLTWTHVGVASMWVVFQAVRSEETGKGRRRKTREATGGKCIKKPGVTTHVTYF